MHARCRIKHETDHTIYMENTMIKQTLVIAISIFIGACASPGPETPAPEVKASSASVEAVAPDNPSNPPAGDLQGADAPDTQQVVSASPENDPNELICRRERETGSKFSTRICRTRAEIEAREEADQKILRESGKIRTGGSCALNKNC